MPDRELLRHSSEELALIGFDKTKTPFPLGSFVAFARFQASHQLDGRTVGESNLLVSPTNPQDRLRGSPYDFKDPAQGFWCVSMPGMTLAAENDVGGADGLNPCGGNR
jgi:hypothetical protein